MVTVGIPIESAYHGAFCEESFFPSQRPPGFACVLIAMTLSSRGRPRYVGRCRGTASVFVSGASPPRASAPLTDVGRVAVVRLACETQSLTLKSAAIRECYISARAGDDKRTGTRSTTFYCFRGLEASRCGIHTSRRTTSGNQFMTASKASPHPPATRASIPSSERYVAVAIVAPR